MGFFDMPRTESAEDMLEKFRVRELVEYERFCRDNALWDSMLACFAQDSRVEISWYQGSGQGFVEASKKMKAKAPHKLNNTLVWLNGTPAAGWAGRGWTLSLRCAFYTRRAKSRACGKL